MTKQAINTRTQEEYDALRKYYKSRDISWRSGDKASEFDGWLIHGEDCCVVLNEEGGPCISQGNMGLYEKEGYEIIPYTEFAKANIVEEKPKSRLFDPKTHKPKPSENDSDFSEDVFIIDEDGMHGLAYYSYRDGEWQFHTDTLVDYNEVGAETEWRWYYPDVQWSEESTEIDYKALYLEGRELLEKLHKSREFYRDSYMQATDFKEDREEVDEIGNKVTAFLTKHNDLI